MPAPRSRMITGIRHKGCDPVPQPTDLRLDQHDLRILDALQRQGDITMIELAEVVHLSQSQCSRRVKQLQASGLIRNYAALLEPTRLGLNLKCYVHVRLRHNADPASAFRGLVEECPEILECAMVTGDGDFLIKTVTRDLEHFREILGRVAACSEISDMRSSIVVEELKGTTALPLGAFRPG